MSRTYLRAVDFLPLARDSLFCIERAKFWIGLCERIGVHANRGKISAQPGTAGRCSGKPSSRWCGRPTRRVDLKVVCDSLSIRAAVALELRFDPIDRCAISRRTLAAITELREAFYRCLVLFEIEVADECSNGGSIALYCHRL